MTYAPRLRQLMHHLRYTPLHPQYLAFRFENMRYKLVAAEVDGRVLDIGCGRQPLRKFLTKDCKYFSLDYPSTGKTLYGARPGTFGDAHKLPFANESFDTVIMLEVLEHLTDPLIALQETSRIVTTGGRIIISTPFLYPIHDAPGDYTRWTYHGLRYLATKCGLSIHQTYTFGSPIESAALLTNLSLAWQILHSPPLIRIPLAFLATAIIPLLNLIGLVGSHFSWNKGQSPFPTGYLLVLH